MPYNTTGVYAGSPTPSDLPEGMAPPAFGSVAGGVHSQAILTNYDFTPQELTQLYERHNYNPSLRLRLKTMGFTRGVKAPTTGHYEAPWKKDNFLCGSVISLPGAPGGAAVIEIDATQMFSETVSGAAVRGSYPKEGDELHLRNRIQVRIQTKDTTVNPHRFTVMPKDGTVQLDATMLFAGARYFIAGSSYAEGTALPQGRIDRVLKYTNTFQIVKEAIRATGTSMTDEVYFDPIPGTRGSLYLRGTLNTEWRFEDACDMALLFGEQNSNNAMTETVAALGYDVPISGTEGMIPYANSWGYTDTYVPGLYQVQNYDDVSAIYEKERIGTNNIAVWQGFSIYQEVENVLYDYVKQSDIDVTTQRSDEYKVSIGFWCLKKSGYTYMFNKIDAFNDIKGAGTNGYDYPNWQIFTPAGYTKDKSSGSTVPTLGYEYKALNGYSRETQVIKLDGTGAIKPATVEDDIQTCGFFSELAFHGCCANQIVIQRPA